ncbi:MAG: zinc metalloprotease HtpX [Methanoregula sp.]|nr:zinc metalloprotease HtpX [Methanoregula sp.]
MKWKRDWELTLRLWLTGFLLLAIYLVFMAVLAMLGVSAIFIVLLAVVMAGIQFFFSDKLVLWSTGAQIVTEDEYPELYRMVSRLCREADLPMPQIAVMKSPVPNAFATGRSPRHAVVACTDSILRMLNKAELEAVLAHELSHVKNRDILTMTLASFVAMIASIVMQNFLFASLFDRDDEGVSAWIIVGLFAVVVYFVAELLIMAISRYREYAADRGSAYITRNPQALISALKKISGCIEALPTEPKAKVEGANAFFIIPALTGNRILEFVSTHPSLEKRIANLEKVEAELRGY